MSAASSHNLFSAVRISGLLLAMTLAASLSMAISPLLVGASMGAATLLWILFRQPVAMLGLLLAFMPMDYMAIELGKFFGLPYMTLVSACTKEVPLLLLLLILWRRNGCRPAAPDWWLLAFFAMAAVRTAFDGSLAGLVTDFSFIIPYFVGRVTVLGPRQEKRWAVGAVWIAAILSVLGMIEVFILGEGPRALLYLATDSQTRDGRLTASFHGIGFAGMREAATMVGPNGFGELCMIALLLWWVYCRNPLPGSMIAAGLIGSVTRSAWLGTATAIFLLAFLMRQKRRLVVALTSALVLFVLSIPVLGLNDYLSFNETGQDPSAEGHRDEIADGLQYAVEHPLGSGNGEVSALSLQANLNAKTFETTYPNFAAEYGIGAVLSFAGCLGSAGYVLWRTPTPLGRAALGILVGLSVLMIFTLPLIDRRLACWLCFPIGLALREADGRLCKPSIAADHGGTMHVR
jgi:hypothetical protein